MTLAFAVILLGLAFLVPPLRYNKFYLINAALVIGAAYFTENNWFRINNLLTYKTLLVFVVFQLVCINITTFVAYGVDKHAAIKKTWRVPEKDLHTLEFLGGWFGAWLGQKFFHHKTSKKSFQHVYHLMIVLEFAAIYLILHFFKIL